MDFTTSIEYSYLLHTALPSYLLLLLELHVTKLFSTWLVRENEASLGWRWRWRCATGTDQPKPAEPQDPGIRKLSSVHAKPQHERREKRERERERKHESENSGKKRGEERAGGRKPGPPQASVALSLHTLRFILLSLKWRLCDYCSSLSVSVPSTNMRSQRIGPLAVSPPDGPSNNRLSPFSSHNHITAQHHRSIRCTAAICWQRRGLHPKRANDGRLVRT
ncbi:hypothetical protein V8C34DRAFT_95903 [Trichoderma compactum]